MCMETDPRELFLKHPLVIICKSCQTKLVCLKSLSGLYVTQLPRYPHAPPQRGGEPVSERPSVCGLAAAEELKPSGAADTNTATRSETSALFRARRVGGRSRIKAPPPWMSRRTGGGAPVSAKDFPESQPRTAEAKLLLLKLLIQTSKLKLQCTRAACPITLSFLF